jgi:inward rectifier potassium channel
MARDPRARLFPIRAEGRKLAPHEDFYHWVLTLTWPRFFGMVCVAFVAANALFAGLYALRPGCIANAENPLELFFFSVQTLGTIGYGDMHPLTRYAHAIVSFEALAGILTTAIITGLTFARFARPTAKVLFSHACVIGPRNGKPHLMFRLANWRRNQVVEAQIRVLVLLTETTAEGETMRRPTPLKLVRDTNQMFAMSWVVMHEIDETSPFFGEDAIARLAQDDADVFVSMSGLDETIMATIHARWRYAMSDIVPNARFVDIVRTEPDGTRVIDFDKFQDIEPLGRAA